MRDARFDRVLLRRANLRRAFVPDFAARLTDATVIDVGRRAKHLLLSLSSGDTLVMHLGMTGDFRVEPRSADAGGAARLEPHPHDHVVFEMSSGLVVTFNDPRRFGAMDLLSADERLHHPTLTGLGPEPLSRDFTAAALAKACAGRRASLKVTLLDQRVVAGLGNIYVVEALHRAGLRRSAVPARSPPARARRARVPRASRRRSRTCSDGPSPRSPAPTTARSASACMTAREALPEEGLPGVIRRSVQAGRSTFACRVCQR